MRKVLAMNKDGRRLGFEREQERSKGVKEISTRKSSDDTEKEIHLRFRS